MNQFTPRANMPENNIPFSSKKALDTTYIPQEELNQANQAKAQEKSDIISKTKNLTAAIVGASALTLNVATANITPDHSDIPKEKALSSTYNIAGITTSRDIKVGFGKPAEAAPTAQTAPNAIPAGVSEAEWNNPDTSTANGLSIALAKMTKNPTLGYKMFVPAFSGLKPEHFSLVQEAYATIIQSNDKLTRQSVALYHIARSFEAYYNAMACIDEFNEKGYLSMETCRKYDFNIEQFGEGMVYSESLNPQAQTILAPYMSEDTYKKVTKEYLRAMEESIKIDKEHNRALREVNKNLQAIVDGSRK